MTKRILIIGGGAVGLFSAYYLCKSGYTVTIADKSDLTDNCSYGNAGLIVPSHVVPLASPGMISTAIKYLFNPRAPIAVKLPPSPAFLKWSYKFVRSASRQHAKSAAYLLKEISLLSKSLYKQFIDTQNPPFLFEEKGLLVVCRSSEVLEEETRAAEVANHVGVEAKVFSREELLEKEPALTEKIAGGVFYPGDCSLMPGSLMKFLISSLGNSGVVFQKNAVVSAIREKSTGAVEVVIDERKLQFDHLVISAGVWSNNLLKMIGKNVPLQPGRGYSFDIQNQNIRFPAVLTDARIAVTPFSDGTLRFGGGMELGYSGKNIFRKRLEEMYKAICYYYPEMTDDFLKTSRVWQGHRPCSFDGLPYIGKVPGSRRIYLATGHSMMGVTLAPATGKLISEMIDGTEPSMELSAFRVNR